MTNIKNILEEMIKKQQAKAREIGSVGEMLVQIKETEHLDCGCCYKLSAPVMDMLAIELGFLQTLKNSIKKIVAGEGYDKTKSKDEQLTNLVDATDKATQAIFKYILEIVQMEHMFGMVFYTKAMNDHRDRFRKNNPSHTPTCFDNLLGIQEIMDKAIKAQAEGKTQDQIMKDIFGEPPAKPNIEDFFKRYMERKEPKTYL